MTGLKKVKKIAGSKINTARSKDKMKMEEMRGKRKETKWERKRNKEA